MRFVTIGLLVLLPCAMAFGDSLFTQEVAKEGTLVSLKKAKFEKGDIVTVLVHETIDAQTDSNTNTKKESDVQSEAGESDNEFLVSPKPDGFGITTAGKLPNWDFQTNNEQRTRGLTQRKNRLITTISCVVTEVFDNGNVQLEGEKIVSVNREDSRIAVKGVARARDIEPDNTIDSAKIANAVVELKGRGPLWNSQRRGLITRFLDWFSPY